jgi:hypothetical protein
MGKALQKQNRTRKYWVESSLLKREFPQKEEDKTQLIKSDLVYLLKVNSS